MFSALLRTHSLLRQGLIAAVALTTMACSDPMIGPSSVEGATATYTQKLECVAQVHEASVTCTPGQTPGSSRVGAPRSELLRPIVLGGQGTYVQLTSSNVSYNSGNQQFSFNVTVNNLIEQPLGANAAGAQHADGVRVFFSQSPTATLLTDPLGSSAISILNADGIGVFTASNQSYYQYNNGPLSRGNTSPSKTWIFTIDPNVQTFSFVVYVSASVQYPDGYLTDFPYVIILDPGEVFVFDPLVKSAVGTVLPDATVTYSNSNTSIASVAVDGTLTGLTRGFGSISLLSGTRPGIYPTSVSVCQSSVVTNGANLPSSIAATDCFSSVGDPNGKPTTSFYADLYRVHLTAGQTITVEMDSGDDLDTYLLMVNRSGTLVVGNDDDETGVLGVGSRLVYTAIETGTYTIEASTFNGLDQGAYTLRISIQ